MQPDGRALGRLAAGGGLSLDVETTSVNDAVTIADQVAAGRSGGVKYVLEL